MGIGCWGTRISHNMTRVTRTSPYDTLLLQIDTDGSDKVDYVMWGDSGVGNFFINHKKLAQLDFSDVFYTWDCC